MENSCSRLDELRSSFSDLDDYALEVLRWSWKAKVPSKIKTFDGDSFLIGYEARTQTQTWDTTRT